ncbi:MAG: hypothetical protein ABUM26_05060 [Solirubrobacterales bacterium]
MRAVEPGSVRTGRTPNEERPVLSHSPTASRAPQLDSSARTRGVEPTAALASLAALVHEVGYSVVFERGAPGQDSVIGWTTRTVSISDRVSIDRQVKAVIFITSMLIEIGERERSAHALSYTEQAHVVESIAFAVGHAIGLRSESLPSVISVWARASGATIEGAAQLVDRVAERIVEHISPAQ